MSSSINLRAVDALDRDAFVQAFGSVFEHFPQAAVGAYEQRPFASVSALHEAMMNVVRHLDVDAQRAFLNRHPLLSGANVRAGTMTADSDAEQKSAGLGELTSEEDALLDRLNAVYLARHGFPFIVCVRHYTREGIFSAFERRIARSTRDELDEALAQIAAITHARLNARLS
ncbi:2-oxo-4-hydroxy-4-carboxy-5-ureidoimidazoline decarboxylase [Caballeronia sp. LZ035]|uniref:2-oxo-4-hydroxy-4-carboxy-5-ureidoimidazoline decarboxylase n=1 Tax=Caballeronia sp. LZ035 TaxID=3038568 RepID=UPI002861E9AE|nr:2-oxo-4-hydroxy-4-carboxy-5-ureidoimidazoline decarboxylase [Caballeronia sp. LZ035]MDR5758884.1 2-oxo-4-hydroxy-4-carboxy-5-ureidoimidazoline decarboxylase [Caballeronia sp. LZ035]